MLLPTETDWLWGMDYFCSVAQSRYHGGLPSAEGHLAPPTMRRHFLESKVSAGVKQ